jgi:hypothetical protein
MESGFLTGGRYRLRERLGHGGMSVVWRAADEVLGRDVAVKVLAPELAADPAVLRHLRDEARAAAGLRHPNVVEVYDYGESAEDGRTLPYVVMELVDGRSLHDLLSGGALPWRLAVVIGRAGRRPRPRRRPPRRQAGQRHGHLGRRQARRLRHLGRHRHP